MEDNDFYSKSQKVLHQAERKVRLKKTTEALEILFNFSETCLDYQEYAICIDAATKAVKYATADGINITESYIEKLLALFHRLHDSLEAENELISLHKLIIVAIKWSKTVYKNGEPRLHEAAGVCSLTLNKFVAAQKHFIHSQNIDKLIEIILHWMKQAPVDERPFFCLRTTLIILQLSTTEFAERFVLSMPFDLDATDTPLPIQLSYLLVKSLETAQTDFELGKLLFTKVTFDYRLVIQADSELKALVQSIQRDKFPSHFNF